MHAIRIQNRTINWCDIIFIALIMYIILHFIFTHFVKNHKKYLNKYLNIFVLRYKFSAIKQSNLKTKIRCSEVEEDCHVLDHATGRERNVRERTQYCH